ncbi:Krueppel-like factor 15 [Orchesella cincta]|uniref:Krueppel-like factor 15 n=1 Tax=Orchesella cincta TaxID=48709 RepID=A0A1D2M7K4_ORCCI|nr:Krueppel-like factor 15 [Orchesella cincta]
MLFLLEQLPLEATDNDTDGEATVKAETTESESPAENEELKFEPEGIELNEESIPTVPEAIQSQITEQNTAGPTEPQNEERLVSENSIPENPPNESQQQLDKYICGFDGCTQSYSRKVNLENHRMTHYGDELFVCDWPDCGLVFGTEEYLQGHVQTHTTPESPYSCLVCQKQFPTPVFLSMHLAIHEVYGETTLQGTGTQSTKRYNTRNSCRATNANTDQPQQTSAFSTDIGLAKAVEPDRNACLSNVTSNQEPTTSRAPTNLMSSIVVGKENTLKQKLIDAKQSRKRKRISKN